MAGFNKRPFYYQRAESDFFESTPKHVLYALVRDFAASNMGEDAVLDGSWLEEARNRIEYLKLGGIVR